MRKGYVDIPEGQIHYREDGSGPPLLLLLHQTPSSSDEYSLMMPILAKKVRVIAMDSMGYGMSDAPPRVFEIPDYARTVKDFLTAMGINRTVIAGHHTGASIAVEVAAAYPEVVDRLILHGCPYYTPEVRKAKLTDSEFRPMEYTAEYLAEQYNRFRTFTPNAGSQNWYRALLGKLTAGPRGEEGHFAVFRYNEQARLPLVKCPVLLLNGDGDLFYKHMEDVRKLIPDCTARVLPGVDALIALSAPEVFAEAILAFIQ
ncbi:MAG: alpha/beta hydrolase [Chloroflexota bacterium]